jgi:hypothetical protein
MDLNSLRWGPVEGFYNFSNEPLRSIIAEFLE